MSAMEKRTVFSVNVYLYDSAVWDNFEIILIIDSRNLDQWSCNAQVIGFFGRMTPEPSRGYHHLHLSAAEQATTIFFQPQRSCANSDSLSGPIMLSMSPNRYWMKVRNRVRCLPGFLFPYGGIYGAYSLYGSSSGNLSTWHRNLSWRVLTFSTFRSLS